MKDLLNLVPGFRSKTRWKSIVALIYYIMCAITLFTDIALSITMFSFSLLVFYTIDLFTYKKKGIPVKRTVALFVATLMLFVISSALVDTDDSSVGDKPKANQVAENSHDPNDQAK